MVWHREPSWQQDRYLRKLGEFLVDRGTPLRRVSGAEDREAATYVAATHIGTIQITGGGNSWAVYLKPLGFDGYVDVVAWNACTSGHKPGFMARQTPQTSAEWLIGLLAQPALPDIDRQCLTAAIEAQRHRNVMSWTTLSLLTLLGIALIVFLSYQLVTRASAITAGFLGVALACLIGLHLNQHRLRQRQRRPSTKQ